MPSSFEESKLLKGSGAIDLNTVRIAGIQENVKTLGRAVVELQEKYDTVVSDLKAVARMSNTQGTLLLLLGVTPEEIQQVSSRIAEAEDSNDDGIDSFPPEVGFVRRAEVGVPIMRLTLALTALENLLKTHLNVSDEEIKDALEEAAQSMQKAVESDGAVQETALQSGAGDDERPGDLAAG